VKPQLTVATRWTSHLQLFETFLKNRLKYAAIAEDHTDVVKNKSIIQTINSMHIKSIAEELKATLSKITHFLLMVNKTFHMPNKAYAS